MTSGSAEGRAGRPLRIALVGMMGSGKSAVARRLAARLRCECVEMDDLIAAEAGRAIPEIFEEEGEAGFRRREVALLRRLARRQGVVVSTGGGVVTTAEARRVLKRHFVTFWLRVSPEEAWRRLGSPKGRPMLLAVRAAGAPPRAGAFSPLSRLRLLARMRRISYQAAGRSIVTTGRRPDEIAATIERHLARAVPGKR